VGCDGILICWGVCWFFYWWHHLRKGC